jgi:hypothetical protein
MRHLTLHAALPLGTLLGILGTARAGGPPPPRLFATPPAVEGESPWGVQLHPEYRVRFVNIQPLELNGEVAKNVVWGEQRLRLDVTTSYAGIGSIFLQADLLDGVLFGDNGRFGHEPTVTSGVGLASQQGNLAGWQVGLLEGGDSLSADGYGPVLRPIEPLRINFAYGEVLLPFGILRAGRMPTSDVGTVSINDGRTGRNRWGASFYHQSADRVLFGTKLSEVFRILAEGDDYVADRRLTSGLFLGLAYDWMVNDEVTLSDDNLHQIAVQLDGILPELCLGGLNLRDLRLTATVSHRFDLRFRTAVTSVPIRLQASAGPVTLLGEFVGYWGKSTEISEGFSALSGRPRSHQEITGYGTRLMVDVEVSDFLFSALYGYASGDPDPRPTTPLSSFSWPRDTNLGLLLFEHILAFQSARAAAVGIENLRQLNAPSFPLTEVATDSRVTNAHLLFPQVFYDPFPWLRAKLGVLFAWTDVPAVDPIRSNLAWDGEAIEDDLVNFNGGKPGTYWGTEIDLGLELRYKGLFGAILEAAYLFPGDAFFDENREAVDSWMVEVRLEFAL